MQKPLKIQALIYALTTALAIAGLMQTDSAFTTGDDKSAGEFTAACECGFLLPADDGEHGHGDTGNIYADIPQLAVPRNQSVGAQPRQHSSAKRTCNFFCFDTALKDGKVISPATFFTYILYIELFPSGTRAGKSRLMALRKLII